LAICCGNLAIPRLRSPSGRREKTIAGHIQRRGDDSWRLHAFIGLDRRGRKRYASKTVHGTKRQAEVALAAFVIETERDRTASAITEPMTVSQVLATWLEAKTPRLSPATVDRYRVAIKLVEPVLGSMGVARLRPHHIDDLYSGLLAAGQSGSSIRKVHWAMRQSLAWAHKRGYTAIVATDGVDLPPLGERKVDPPASADVRKVLEHILVTDPDWGALIAFVTWTGCRRGEVCGLHWDDVDLDAGNVLIRRAVVAIPGGSQEKGTKTGEIRRIALGPRTVELLRDLHERCRDRARECGVELAPSAYVFSPDAAGRRPYNPHTITNIFVSACKEAGVPPIRLHDLRHHSATTLLKNGASVGEVMDRHGWRSVAMVNRYRHLLEAGDLEAAKTLENA
jgi:integrase